MKPVILTMLAHYLPGYRSGGPLRSVFNLVDHLGDEFTFRMAQETALAPFGVGEPVGE